MVLQQKLTNRHLPEIAACAKSLKSCSEVESCSGVVGVEMPALVVAREDAQRLEAVVEFPRGQPGRTWLGHTHLSHRPHSTGVAAA